LSRISNIFLLESLAQDAHELNELGGIEGLIDDRPPCFALVCQIIESFSRVPPTA
jgi:hypothetical protein